MTENERFELILERLCGAEKGQAFFNAQEISKWPPGVFEALFKAGFFEEAPPVEEYTCSCDNHCPSTVHSSPLKENCPPWIFIVCEKDGIITLTEDQLKQWRMTRRRLAKTIARLLGFQTAPKEEDNGKCWVLGLLKGKKNGAQVELVLEGRARLECAGHEIFLYEVCKFQDGNFQMDLDEMKWRVDHPSKNPRYIHSTAGREARKRGTQERNEIIRELRRELKTEKPGKTNTWYSEKIALQLKEQGYEISAATVRRNFRK